MSPDAKSLLKQVRSLRSFPHNTSPASRHLELIAEALAKGETYPMLTEEPEHCAETMLAVLVQLYEAKAANPIAQPVA